MGQKREHDNNKINCVTLVSMPKRVLLNILLTLNYNILLRDINQLQSMKCITILIS